MIEKGEKLWLMLIIHIITKRNDSVNVILLCALHVRESFLISNDNKQFYKKLFIILFIYLLGSANILNLLAK